MPLIKSNLTRFNDATTLLFDLIYEDEDHIAELLDLLEASCIQYKTEKNRRLAVNVERLAELREDTISYPHATCLDIVIIKNKPDYFAVLAKHIFDNPLLCDAVKSTIYLSALCRALTCKRNVFVELLLQRKYNINQSLPTQRWNYEGATSPLTMAVASRNVEALTLLLLNDADPHFLDSKENSAIKLAKSMLRDLKADASREKIVALLNCVDQLKRAEKAYYDHDSAGLYCYVASAIKCNHLFANDYIKTMAERAVMQLQDPSDNKDYRFLIGFMRALASILKNPCDNHDQQIADYEKFQLDTVQLIVGAYDCDAPTPSHIHKLFQSREEKLAFLTTPITAHLLDGLHCEKTLMAMKEGEFFPPEHPLKTSTGLNKVPLVMSMISGGLLKSPAINDNDRETSPASLRKEAPKHRKTTTEACT